MSRILLCNQGGFKAGPSVCVCVRGAGGDRVTRYACEGLGGVRGGRNGML